jgi:Fungal specific transcription factor domain
MPIVDKKSFMEEFKKYKEGEPLFSTALLYSVCSVGCRLLYVSDPIFQKCKMSKDQLLLMAMDKANAAVSRNYLNTKMEIIQSLVLLASQPNFAANAYTAWMFSGMGVRMVGFRVLSEGSSRTTKGAYLFFFFYIHSGTGFRITSKYTNVEDERTRVRATQTHMVQCVHC